MAVVDAPVEVWTVEVVTMEELEALLEDEDEEETALELEAALDEEGAEEPPDTVVSPLTHEELRLHTQRPEKTRQHEYWRDHRRNSGRAR